MQKHISFKINRGPKFALEIVKGETDLTAEMIARLALQYLLPCWLLLIE
jgi:plasmid maintenance system antidote protein VapI